MFKCFFFSLIHVILGIGVVVFREGIYTKHGDNGKGNVAKKAQVEQHNEYS